MPPEPQAQIPLLGLVPLFTWSGKTRKLAATEADCMPCPPHEYLLTGTPSTIVHAVTKAHKQRLETVAVDLAALRPSVALADLARHKWT